MTDDIDNDEAEPFELLLEAVCESFQATLSHYGLTELEFCILVSPRPHLDTPDAMVIAGSPGLHDDDGMTRLLGAAPVAWRIAKGDLH